MTDELDRRIRRRSFFLFLPYPISVACLIAGVIWSITAFVVVATVGLAVETAIAWREGRP